MNQYFYEANMVIQISRQVATALTAAVCIASLTACGGGSTSSPAATASIPAPAPVREQGLREFVGAVSEPLPGLVDGAGSVARFAYPRGLAIDARGNIFVADTSNDAVRQVTPAGAVTTLARLAGGTSPKALAVDSAGNVYINDYRGNLQRITADGSVSPVPLPTAQLDPGYPYSIAKAIGVDGAGHMYVEFRLALQLLEDCGSYGPHVCQLGFKTSVVQITPTGQWSTVASVVGFQSSGMAVDRAGNVYLSGYVANTILKITLSGQVTTFAGTAGVAGAADGTGPAASFLQPNQMAADAAGNVYVDDSGNHTIRKITPDGRVTTIAGTAGSDKLALGPLPGGLPAVGGLAVDGGGNLVVSVPHGLIRIMLP